MSKLFDELLKVKDLPLDNDDVKKVMIENIRMGDHKYEYGDVVIFTLYEDIGSEGYFRKCVISNKKLTSRISLDHNTDVSTTYDGTPLDEVPTLADFLPKLAKSAKK